MPLRPAVSSLLALLALVTAGGAGCDDPGDPKYWIKRLKDRDQEELALDRISKIDVERARAVLPELIQFYRITGKPGHLEALARYHDPRTTPLFLEALAAWKEKPRHGIVAVRALADPPVAEAMGKLLAVVETPLPPDHAANEVRIEAIRLLTRADDRRLVPLLVRTLSTPLATQDFRLHKRAAEWLAAHPDPQALSALIEGLFLDQRGDSTFQECRLGLARLGPVAIPHLLDLVAEKEADLIQVARRRELDVAWIGLLPMRAAIVLGDLRAEAAVPRLAARLRKAPPVEALALIQALGHIGTPAAMDPLIAVAHDPAAPQEARVKATEALALSGDEFATTVLLDLVEKGAVAAGGQPAPWLRLQAAINLARVAGPEQAAALRALIAKETDPYYKECLTRMQLAETCKTEVACYAAHLRDPALPLAEKAAYALGFSGDRAAAIPALVEALGPLSELPAIRYPVYQAVLVSLERLGDKTCKPCLERLRRNIALDDKLLTHAPRAQELLREARLSLAYLERKEPAAAAK
jgi:HEAT repeat protein